MLKSSSVDENEYVLEDIGRDRTRPIYFHFPLFLHYG
ncbi:hypothetical protein C8N40_11595 [Pontibacter mucosus]|uniref:Uncharacterized protein n=1 Tax=Pontibacter mucosus TaxID=1649266 RepID=A0A2T5Y558_9BACT|nr:hypothetical protein C8N40_11595 [Pontibacter mucosus]